MKPFDFAATVCDGNVYCVACIPMHLLDECVQPIFACSEWDYYPTCDVCGCEHSYVTLTRKGYSGRAESRSAMLADGCRVSGRRTGG
jgi:hypothetical protein